LINLSGSYLILNKYVHAIWWLSLVYTDNVKTGDLKRKNRDHKKVPKQDEDAGNLQILLHLRSAFWLYGIAFAIIPFAMYLHSYY